ncbi:Bud-site selection protein [Hypoxylon sp. NC1633]|nr:Bud-site selection protein [Hypoxylon sp. NC1633]
MPKRKRSYEPSLVEKLEKWHKELARGMKTAKGFERQRLSKRIREAQADAAKVARLEREIAVLKSLDLQQAAHAHLCSSLLKIKGVAEAPALPADIVRPIPKPEGLSEEEKVALHNVTSALCNRKQIRDVIEEAVMGTCIALKVPMPEKMKKAGKGKKEKKADQGRAGTEEQADDKDDVEQPAYSRKEEAKDKDEYEQSDLKEGEPEPVLLKRKRGGIADDAELESDNDTETSDEQPFEGFPDSDAEERAWSRYDDFVVGSSDESDDGESGNEDDFADDRVESIREVIPNMTLAEAERRMQTAIGLLSERGIDPATLSKEQFSIFANQAPEPQAASLEMFAAHDAKRMGIVHPDENNQESPEPYDQESLELDEKYQEPDEEGEEREEEKKMKEESDISESDSSGFVSPQPHKKAKTKASGPISAGNSAFLPTLMGGYISGSESEASDIDVGPARKNRRGQRARQAIWEKKFKEKAKHLQKQQEKKERDQGWDMRRGAVGGDEDEGGNKPWKKGIRNPFDNQRIHPERQQQMQGRSHGQGGDRSARERPEMPKAPAPPPKRDDAGPLHPSWAAAKKAKEEGQKIAFQGRKVVFD